jgi:hypothetical protein
MRETDKGPTDISTRPLGNSTPPPTPLARGGISPHAAAKLKTLNPDATKNVRSTLQRQQRGGDGHARG